MSWEKYSVESVEYNVDQLATPEYVGVTNSAAPLYCKTCPVAAPASVREPLQPHVQLHSSPGQSSVVDGLMRTDAHRYYARSVWKDENDEVKHLQNQPLINPSNPRLPSSLLGP